MAYRLIVAGSRDFTDYDRAAEEITTFIEEYGVPDEIVCGEARGADMLGARYGKENDIHVEYFPADWNFHGKSAGYKRNELMAKYSSHCLLFWDGISKGTGHMKNLADKHNLTTKVVLFEKS